MVTHQMAARAVLPDGMCLGRRSSSHCAPFDRSRWALQSNYPAQGRQLHVLFWVRELVCFG